MKPGCCLCPSPIIAHVEYRQSGLRCQLEKWRYCEACWRLTRQKPAIEPVHGGSSLSRGYVWPASVSGEAITDPHRLEQVSRYAKGRKA